MNGIAGLAGNAVSCPGWSAAASEARRRFSCESEPAKRRRASLAAALPVL